MDIHPIVIHFPIAFLTIYSIFELLRFKKLMDLPHWFFIKAILVIIGWLGALVAVLSGLKNAWGVEGIRILDMHRNFGLITLAIYAPIALGYAFEWFRPTKSSLKIMNPKVLVPLAILGLIAITITGGIGGAMLRGTDFDPLMRPIFNLLKIS